MLIVLDLDDTLIDTSGCLRSQKLLDSLRQMAGSGLMLNSFEEGWARLQEIDASSESIQETLEQFLVGNEQSESLLQIGLKEYYENISSDCSVHALKDAATLLHWLHGHHEIALVTLGLPQQQLLKMRQANIDLHLFSRIVVVNGGSKRSCYQEMMTDLGYPSNQTLVCGDKVEVDLLPAKALGCITVHMQWGRSSAPSSLKMGLSQHIDYAIKELNQLQQIVASLSEQC